METTFEKQRKYSRHKAPKGMFVGWRSGGKTMVSRADVVGMGGLFLHTANPLPLGAVVELVFDLKTGEVRARAVVRDSSDGKGMGVQFVQMETTARARLNSFLMQHVSAEAENS